MSCVLPIQRPSFAFIQSIICYRNKERTYTPLLHRPLSEPSEQAARGHTSQKKEGNRMQGVYNSRCPQSSDANFLWVSQMQVTSSVRSMGVRPLALWRSSNSMCSKSDNWVCVCVRERRYIIQGQGVFHLVYSQL